MAAAQMEHRPYHRAASGQRESDGICRTFIENCYLETSAPREPSVGSSAARGAYVAYFTACPD